MRRGFTLIELLVAIAISAVIAGSGITTSMQAVRKREVGQAALKLEGILVKARANSQAGMKINCGVNTLLGWQVTTSSNTYTLSEVCSTVGAIAYESGVISSSNNITATSQTVLFLPLSRGLDSPHGIVINGYGWEERIDVSTNGEVKKNDLAIAQPSYTPAATPTLTIAPTATPPVPTNTTAPVPTSTPTPTVPPPHLYWNLNENSGTTVFDSSGNSNTGSISGNPTWTTGRYGSALNFDGNGDYVRESLMLFNPSSPFSVLMWVYPTANTPSAAWAEISSGTTCADNPQIWAHSSNGSLIFSRCGNGAGMSAGSISSLLNGWHHLAFTYDSSNNTRAYVDGQLVGTPYNFSWPSILFARFTAGASRSGTQFYTGRLDEIRLYNTTLTQQQIVTIMNSAN